MEGIIHVASSENTILSEENTDQRKLPPAQSSPPVSGLRNSFQGKHSSLTPNINCSCNNDIRHCYSIGSGELRYGLDIAQGHPCVPPSPHIPR